LLFNQ
jgi:hypothetical protein